MKRTPWKNLVLPINDIQLTNALGFVYLMGVVIHLIFLYIFYRLGVTEMQIVNYFSPIVYFFAFLLNRSKRVILASTIAVIEAAAHGIISLLFVGWQTNFHIYILLIYILIFFLYNIPLFVRIILSILITTIYSISFIFSVNHEPLYTLDSVFISSLGIFNVVCCAAILSLFASTYSFFIRQNMGFLKKAEEQQRILNAQKNQFFSIFSHDLKNPVTTLHGFVDLMLNRYDYIDDAKRKTYLIQIHNTVGDLNGLVKSLLEWSKSQLDNVKVLPVEVNVCKELESIKSLLEHYAISKEISIELLNLKGATVFADEQMFKSIMRNIISNAIKFTSLGGKVKVMSKTKMNNTIISVSDNGIGIPLENISSIFNLDKKTIRYGTAQEKGTGLGLVVAKQFADKNHGTIMVESMPEQGTTFSVILPTHN